MIKTASSQFWDILRWGYAHIRQLTGVLILTGLAWLSPRWIGPVDRPAAVVLCLWPVGISVVLWGAGPGLIAAVLAAAGWSWILPGGARGWTGAESVDVLLFLALLGTILGADQIKERRRALALPATRPDWAAAQLSELSLALVEVHERPELARALVKHLRAMFRADAVTLIWHDSPLLQVNDPADWPADRPLLIIPVETARGWYGEVLFWREAPLNLDDEVLLRRSVGQGALALERSRQLERDRTARLNQERERAAAAVLSGVSHHLRTPLAAIKASLSGLRSGNVRPESRAGRELLALADDETDHLNRLLADLLDLARLEAGAQPLHHTWNSLQEITSSAVARLRPWLDCAALVLQCPDDLPLIPVDEVLLARALSLMVEYALRAAPPNARVSLSAAVGGDQLNVTVVCPQQGLPDAELERLFERGRTLMGAVQAGPRVELSIARGLVDLHGGRLWAEPSGMDTALRLVLPLPATSVRPIQALLQETDGL